MLDYSQRYNTRGSALYTDEQGQLRDGLDECFRFSVEDEKSKDVVQEVAFKEKECVVNYRPIRPLPDGGGFFENVWKEFRENKNIY